MNKVIVVGSVNMDITARTDKLPDTGETVAARFSMRENTVKTTLHRTRRRLRDYLEQEELL